MEVLDQRLFYDLDAPDADIEAAGDMTLPVNLAAPSKAQKSC